MSELGRLRLGLEERAPPAPIELSGSGNVLIWDSRHASAEGIAQDNVSLVLSSELRV